MMASAPNDLAPSHLLVVRTRCRRGSPLVRHDVRLVHPLWRCRVGGGGIYTRDMIQALLPAVWDDSYCYGAPAAPNAPPPDMPKGYANKAQANTLYAALADIKAAWKKAPLTMRERRCLLLRFGFDYEYQDIGAIEGVTKQGAQTATERGVGRLMFWLNGADPYEGLDYEQAYDEWVGIG